MKTQKEMADFGGCSAAMIQSSEIARRPLSTPIATKISQRTGIDLAWLMSDDPDAPMINQAGEPYSYDADFERRQTNRSAPDASHYRWRELQLGDGFDLLHRLLGANRLKGEDAVAEFMDNFADFLKTQLKKHVKLEDTVYGEIRRAREAALKTGKIIPLGFLTPTDIKPLRRGRERLGQAIAAFTSGQARKSWRRARRVKSDYQRA
jgi:hypothetical protein